MEIEMHEIRSRAEFEGLKLARTGVIVVVDVPKGMSTAHRPFCEYPSSEDFGTKVIENRGRNGRYYFFVRAADARTALGAEPCKICGLARYPDLAGGQAEARASAQPAEATPNTRR